MSIKNKIAQLFKKKQRITITFTPGSNGYITTTITKDRRIYVGYALTALQRFEAEIGAGDSRKMYGRRV